MNLELHAIIWGILGIITILLFNLYEWTQKPKIEKPPLKSFVYWMPYMLYIFLCVIILVLFEADQGGVLKEVIGLKAEPLTKSFCYYTGLSMPTIARSLSQTFLKK